MLLTKHFSSSSPAKADSFSVLVVSINPGVKQGQLCGALQDGLNEWKAIWMEGFIKAHEDHLLR